MTASELLRKLDERMTPAPWRDEFGVDDYDIATLRNALPPLTAAIEAAEKLDASYDVTLDRIEQYDEIQAFRAALAALSAALTEGDT